MRVKTPEDFSYIMADAANLIFFDTNYDAYVLLSDGTFAEID